MSFFKRYCCCCFGVGARPLFGETSRTKSINEALKAQMDYNRNFVDEVPSEKLIVQISYEPTHILREVLQFKQPVMIGSGAFGAVFKATIETEERCQPVAVKVYQFQCVNIFGYKWRSYLDEIELLRNLKHPNIVEFLNCYEIYADREHPESRNGFHVVQDQFTSKQMKTNLKLAAIAMEQLDMNLLQYKQKFSLESFDQALLQNIFEQIGQALAYMHEEHCIAHQDIKLDNIVFKQLPLENGDSCSQRSSKTAVLKLVDFGNAQVHQKVDYNVIGRRRNATPFDDDAKCLGLLLIQSSYPIPNYKRNLPNPMLMHGFIEQDEDEEEDEDQDKVNLKKINVCFGKTTVKDRKFRSVLTMIADPRYRYTMKEALDTYNEYYHII